MSQVGIQFFGEVDDFDRIARTMFGTNQTRWACTFEDFAFVAIDLDAFSTTGSSIFLQVHECRRIRFAPIFNQDCNSHLRPLLFARACCHS